MSEYAVLIPIVATEEGDALLMEVRSENVRQPGEVCFPGGRIEEDESPEQTAVRETCEELGIGPEDIELSEDAGLEEMSDWRRVWLVSGRIDPESLARLRLSDGEVADVFLLPLRWLFENPSRRYDIGTDQDGDLPKILKKYLLNYDSSRKTGYTDYWEFDGRGIWGLTARIIRRIMTKTDLNQPGEENIVK